MKIIESALIGTCPITARDKSVRLFQIKQALNQHREFFINSLLKDIPYFIGQKYQAYATAEEIEVIKSKLVNLRSKDINLADYASIVTQIQRRTSVRINNAEFFREIDALLLGKRITHA